MKKKTLYILLESQVRELESLILLSALAAKRGYRVYMADHYSLLEIIKKKKSFGGIFITKGSSTIEVSKIIKKKCNYNIILDQEISPGYSKLYYDYILTGRQFKGSLKYVDRFYCVNKIVAERAKKILNKSNKNLKVVTTGWPRLDLARKEFNGLFKKKSDQLKKKYKKFILFNSDIGLVSNENIKEFEQTPIFTDKKKKFVKLNSKIRNNFKTHAIKDFNKVKIFFKKLSNNNNIPNIVIRPHPSETMSSWKKITDYSKNFFLEKPTYDVSAAILASNHVLHRGCTTGYQALVNGKPTGYLNLLNENKKIEHFRPTLLKFSKNLKSTNEFTKWTGSKKKITKNRNLFKLLNIDHKYSAEKILDDLDKLDVNLETNHKSFKLYTLQNIYYHKVKNLIYDTLVLLNIKKERNYHLKNRSKKINNFFKKKNISSCIKWFNENIKNLKNIEIKTKKISENLFEMQKK